MIYSSSELSNIKILVICHLSVIVDDFNMSTVRIINNSFSLFTSVNCSVSTHLYCQFFFN
jgi:hypothetical protein